MALVDYERMAASYDAGRAIAPQALEAWRDAVAPYLPSAARLRILDLGSGTGRFSPLMAGWFDAEVIAVEPAEGMRREAQGKAAHPAVAWVGGDAGHVPLRDASCDVAWLSLVIHHVDDLPACARDLRRVLRPGGPVVIRGSFPGRNDRITLYEYFPAAKRVGDSFTTVEQTVEAFGAAGFRMEALESVRQESSPSFRAFRDRARFRADSTLEAISDDEFAVGMARLDAATDAETDPQPIVDWLDLMVLR